jgi:hypothetical protein
MHKFEDLNSKTTSSKDDIEQRPLEHLLNTAFH